MKKSKMWLVSQSHEKAVKELKSRIEQLEEALNDIYHSTSCTSTQMKMIEEVMPQKIVRKSERPPESGWRHEPGLMG